jgi:hypothetical protein
MPITQLTSYHDLVQWLTDDNVPHRADEANLAVEIPVDTAPLSGLLYLRWERKLPYLQIIHPFVLDVPEPRVRDVETAIIRANNVIPLPGLGFQYERRFVYMRLCVPIYDGMRADNVRKQIVGVLNNATDFLGPFKAIVAGKAGEQILELAVQDANERARAKAH